MQIRRKILGISLPVWLTFFGALLTAVGAFWTTVQSDADQKKLNQEIRERDETIIEKSAEIARLSQDALKSVTGGDAFAELMPTFYKNNKISFMVMNNSKYPLYDLQIKILDQDYFSKEVKKYKVSELSEHISSIYKASEKIIKIGNLGAMQATMDIAIYDLGNAGSRNFSINSLARNGHVNQSIMMRENNKFAVRIIGDKGLLYENVDPKFPQDQLWSDRDEWLAKKVEREEDSVVE